MKKLLIAISMVLILGGLAQANSSRNISYQGQSSGPITGQSSYISLDARGGNIYNITLDAGANNAVMTIYDSNGNGGPDVGWNGETVVYEIEVATAGDSRTIDFSTAPIQTFNGITASVTNGVGYMNIER